jgi:hypothetical protein
MKLIKDAYKKLARIKRPVLIYLRAPKGNEDMNRIRILYPNGLCEYLHDDSVFLNDEFARSCFHFDGIQLSHIVKRMKKYDGNYLRIYKIEKL